MWKLTGLRQQVNDLHATPIMLLVRAVAFDDGAEVYDVCTDKGYFIHHPSDVGVLAQIIIDAKERGAGQRKALAPARRDRSWGFDSG